MARPPAEYIFPGKFLSLPNWETHGNLLTDFASRGEKILYSSMLPFAAEDFQISWRVTDIKKFLAPLPPSPPCKMNVFFKKSGAPFMDKRNVANASAQRHCKGAAPRGSSALYAFAEPIRAVSPQPQAAKKLQSLPSHAPKKRKPFLLRKGFLKQGLK
ncbi:MAG: hypothetical protein J5828_05925 [Desulfovibrionaceae bacterium]|nr:hypothetical protein [Desulfovibrionaceae bacterium]